MHFLTSCFIISSRVLSLFGELSYCNDAMNKEHFPEKESIKKEQLVCRQMESFYINKFAKSYACNLRFCASK